MIDTKELRLLVQDYRLAGSPVFIQAADMNEILDRLEASESECLEQARLNGMGSEREAALMAKLEAAEKSDAESLAMYRKARDERDALRAALRHEADCVEAAKAEIEALRAKITEMEQQEPVSWADAFGEPFRQKSEIDGVASPLYALPGAQNVPDFADAYQGAMEEAAIWKKRALEAEDLNRKFIAEINGPTYMGEPVQLAPSVPREAIAKILTEVMNIAVSNGADSRSMPDEYVEVAAWLCGVPCAKGE